MVDTYEFHRALLNKCQSICRYFGTIVDESSGFGKTNDSVGYYEDGLIKIHCSADSFCRVWIAKNGWTLVYDCKVCFVEPKVHLKGAWYDYIKQLSQKADKKDKELREQCERAFQERLKSGRVNGTIDDSDLFK